MAMNVMPFVGTDNFNMETFNNMISQINNGVNSEISEVLAQLGTKAKIQTGSYVGTGTYGAGNPCSLTFDFPPDLILFTSTENPNAMSSSDALNSRAIMVRSYNSYESSAGGYFPLKITWDGNSVSWYSEGSERTQINKGNQPYAYCAIG